jgi:hypothetical protein
MTMAAASKSIFFMTINFLLNYSPKQGMGNRFARSPQRYFAGIANQQGGSMGDPHFLLRVGKEKAGCGRFK